MNKQLSIYMLAASFICCTTNSMDFPPTTFSWENFATLKQLRYAAEIAENLPAEVDYIIAQMVLALDKKNNIDFVLTCILKLDQNFESHYIKTKLDLEKLGKRDTPCLARRNVVRFPKNIYSDIAISSNNKYAAYLEKDAICLYEIANKQTIKKLPQREVNRFVFSPDSTKLISGTGSSSQDIIQWNIEDIDNITNTILFKRCLPRNFIFNRDKQHLFIDFWDRIESQFYMINIKNLNYKSISTVPSSSGKTFFRVFEYNTDFVLCYKWDGGWLVNSIYTKQGDCICSRLISDSLAFDWDKLSVVLQNKSDQLLEVNKTLTTAQLMLLDRICTQKRAAGETIVIKKGSAVAKTLESFKNNKPFIQENLLITEK